MKSLRTYFIWVFLKNSDSITVSCYAARFPFFLHYAKPDFIFDGRLLSFKVVYGYMLCVVYIAKCSSDIGKVYSADGWGGRVQSSPSWHKVCELLYGLSKGPSRYSAAFHIGAEMSAGGGDGKISM